MTLEELTRFMTTYQKIEEAVDKCVGLKFDKKYLSVRELDIDYTDMEVYAAVYSPSGCSCCPDDYEGSITLQMGDLLDIEGWLKREEEAQQRRKAEEEERKAQAAARRAEEKEAEERRMLKELQEKYA